MKFLDTEKKSNEHFQYFRKTPPNTLPKVQVNNIRFYNFLEICREIFRVLRPPEMKYH